MLSRPNLSKIVHQYQVNERTGKCVSMLDRFGKGGSRVNIGQFSWRTGSVVGVVGVQGGL